MQKVLFKENNEKFTNTISITYEIKKCKNLHNLNENFNPQDSNEI